MLLLCKHSHHNECMEIDTLAEHPEIVATQHVHVEEVQNLTANLQREAKHEDWLCVGSDFDYLIYIKIIAFKHSYHHHSMT